MSFSTCNAAADINPLNKSLPAQVIYNVSYGKDSMQVMDVYLPAGRSIDQTKSLVLIHGGGWNGGSKSDFITYIDSFKKRMPDYAIFNINYRLVNENNIFPAQENDVRSSVNFIASKADDYHINKDKMALLGASAGAHLALLQAYKYNEPKIKAVIDFFGPADLVSMYDHPWHPMVKYALQMVTGTPYEVNPDIYRQSSPVNFISTQSAPTLIFHGSSDYVVDVSQSKELKSKLQQAGIPNELVIYPGERHGWHGANLSNSFDHIARFLNKYLH